MLLRKRMFLASVQMALLSVGLVSNAVAYTAPVENRVTVNNEQGWSQPQAADNYGTQNYVDANATPEQPRTASPADTTTQTGLVSAETKTKTKPNYLTRLDELEIEVRELRGQIEAQTHKIKQMASIQTQLFQDLDSRVNALAEAPKTAPNTAKQAEPSSIDAANTVKHSANEQQAYQTAYSLLRNKQFAQAKQAMAVYLTDYPNGQYAVNAHYWLGELSLLTGDSQAAETQFATVISQFPTSSKVSDAMLKMGLIYLEKGNQHAAKQQFRKLVQSFPNSASANIAKKRLQQL